MRTTHTILVIMAGLLSMSLASNVALAYEKMTLGKQRAAPVFYKSSGAKKGSMVGTRGIRAAVNNGIRSYLLEKKFGGSMTRAKWNRIDLKSLSLQDVTIETGRRDSYGFRLKKGEFLFTSHIKARKGKAGKKKTITMEVKSVIQLLKTRPRLSGYDRVKTTPELTAKDAAHLKDTSTAYWID